MITRYKDFSEKVQQAQYAIDILTDDKKKAWLQKILDLLKEQKYVIICDEFGFKLDVSEIANTHYYLSFFDVYNFIRNFNTDIEPIETDQLRNTIILT